MKNVIKAVKKLNWWSRKRRKKKIDVPYYPPPPPPPYPPPPPPCHYCCSCSFSAQPSAPPLPSWLEAEQNYGTFVAPDTLHFPEFNRPSQVQVPQQEIVRDPPQEMVYPTLPVSSSSTSYQQYMVPEPVNGMPLPVTQTVRKERSTWQFGCVYSFGAYLFRCLFPCFHIREVV